MLLDIACAKKCYSTRSSPSGRSPRLPHTILCNSTPSSNTWHLFTPWTEPLICDANCQPSHVKLSAPGCITGQTLELTNLGDLETCHFFKNGWRRLSVGQRNNSRHTLGKRYSKHTFTKYRHPCAKQIDVWILVSITRTGISRSISL